MSYLQSKIFKISEDLYIWSIGQPVDRSSKADNIHSAWWSIKKKITRLESYFEDFPIFYSEKHQHLYLDMSYYYCLARVSGNLLYYKDNNVLVSIEDIKDFWGFDKYENILNKYKKDRINHYDADDPNDVEMYDIHTPYRDYGLEVDHNYPRNTEVSSDDYFVFENLQTETPFLRKSDVSTNRQKDILEWLEDSKHGRRFKVGGGFYIIRGLSIKLRDGEILDILDWLIGEGFSSITQVMNYDISYTAPNSEYSEKISFFDRII